MRSTSNPGGIGHDWVRARFVDAHEPGRLFIPAGLSDNPHLDREDYLASLDNLDAITRAQLLNGDWTVREPGGLFERSWFEVVEKAPEHATRVRYWDLAATEAKPGTDPDWTAGARLAFVGGVTYIEDLVRIRANPGKVENLVRSTAESDGRTVTVWMEQEPGSSGKVATDHYRRNVLPDYTFYADKVTGSKTDRARPLSAQASAGNVKLVRGGWNAAFIDEAEAFPLVSHDDQVDAVSGAHSKLTARPTLGPLSKPKGW
jgi:predicted phage terminase large subunit-like protein